MKKEIERLAKIDRRNRNNVAAYVARRRGEGSQPISAILSRDAYKALLKLKKSAKAACEPCTTGDIIGELLLNAGD